MVTVKISASLWLRWAAIAVEHERRAEAARDVLEARKAVDRSLDMRDELEASMICVSAAAHAIDGLYGTLREHLDPELRRKWADNRKEGKGPRRPAQVFETLKRVAGLKPTVGQRIEDLYKLRDAAVHHAEEIRETTPHPSPILATNVSWEYARYTVEAARTAVTLMLEIAQVVVDNGPLSPSKSQSWQTRLDELAVARWP